MAANLISVVMQFLTPEVIEKIAAFLALDLQPSSHGKHDGDGDRDRPAQRVRVLACAEPIS